MIRFSRSRSSSDAILRDAVTRAQKGQVDANLGGERLEIRIISGARFLLEQRAVAAIARQRIDHRFAGGHVDRAAAVLVRVADAAKAGCAVFLERHVGRDRTGHPAPAGVYFVRALAGGREVMARLALMR